MPVVDVINLDGKTVGQLELADDVFAAEVNPHLLHEAVRHFLAGERAGTHKTKDKSEVSGSGKKLWKQKGTGRARIGSIRSPLWRHGGTVHGPVPRKYGYALPKKMILGALRSALTTKLSQQKLFVVDGWQLESHKTKAFRAALSKLDGEAKSILLVDAGDNVNLERASRNLEGVTLVEPSRLGPYDLLRHDRLMLSREAAAKLSGALSATKSNASPEQASDQGAKQASATTAAADAELHPAKAAAKKPVKASAKAAPKAAKKPAVKKAAAKPKAKKE
ncbi:MAG TPA: 50S ribosomal protein L4 [Candidatus Dormibacteraeota bacterium]|nr:50S ribosomal protein L4 [Candidatus Dormibacteraeota bacterium]